MKIECFEELPSTQTYIKTKRCEGNDLIVTAKRQSGGLGTKGRSFSSDEGGMYLSKLVFYQSFPAKEAFKIMAGAAVAVCETLYAFGLEPKIKWPNDVHVNGLKICGILIENTLSGHCISSSIVGIGLNVRNRLPDELLGIATTMSAQAGRTFSVEEVFDRLVSELKNTVDMQKYQRYLGYMGEEVNLILDGERIPATLLSVDDEGGLWAEVQGESRRFTAAEVSVKIEK